MKGVLFDLDLLNKLVRAINTKLLPSRKYQLRELPDAIYDVYYKEVNRVRKDLHDLIYGPKRSFVDEYGLIKRIGQSMFMHRTDLEQITFPECLSIYMGAFAECTNLSEISFPKASFIEGNAFQSCTALTSISNLPSGSIHLANIFCDCKRLSYVSLNWSYIPIGTFKGCDNLVNVNIPNATIISGNAFENCLALSQINLDSVETIKGYAFANCTSLEELSIPNCIQIGYPATYADERSCAFVNCTNLRKVYAPKCISIFRATFMNCYALSDIFLPMLSSISASLFENNISISNISLSAFYNAYCIGSSAFKNCTSLENASFNNVFCLGENAFYGCTKLQSIEFNGAYNSSYSTYLSMFYDRLVSNFVSQLVGLNSFVFAGCTSLRNVSFPNLNIIYHNAFDNCVNLSYLSFSLCRYVGKRAFNNCENLEEIHLSNCKVFNKSAFFNCLNLHIIDAPSCNIIGNATFENCQSLESVSFPEAYYCSDSELLDGPGEFMSRLFYNCTALQNVYMPKYMLTSGQASLFENCVNLENIVLSSEGTVIGTNTFRNCYKLSSFNFTNIISICASAFENCSALTEVIAANCTYLGGHAFKNCISLSHVQTSTIGFEAMGGTEVFANCYNLEEVNFENGGGYIYGSSIFVNCSKLKSITDSTLGLIYDDAFLNCESLSIADLGAKTIRGARAFANCINLKEVHIAGFTDRYNAAHTITADGLYFAFSGCVNLKSLYITSQVIAYDPDKFTFYSCDFLEHGRLYVPSSVHSLYMASSMGWINYMSAEQILSF